MWRLSTFCSQYMFRSRYIEGRPRIGMVAVWRQQGTMPAVERWKSVDVCDINCKQVTHHRGWFTDSSISYFLADTFVISHTNMKYRECLLTPLFVESDLVWRFMHGSWATGHAAENRKFRLTTETGHEFPMLRNKGGGGWPASHTWAHFALEILPESDSRLMALITCIVHSFGTKGLVVFKTRPFKFNSSVFTITLAMMPEYYLRLIVLIYMYRIDTVYWFSINGMVNRD